MRGARLHSTSGTFLFLGSGPRTRSRRVTDSTNGFERVVGPLQHVSFCLRLVISENRTCGSTPSPGLESISLFESADNFLVFVLDLGHFRHGSPPTRPLPGNQSRGHRRRRKMWERFPLNRLADELRWSRPRSRICTVELARLNCGAGRHRFPICRSCIPRGRRSNKLCRLSSGIFLSFRSGPPRSVVHDPCPRRFYRSLYALPLFLSTATSRQWAQTSSP